MAPIPPPSQAGKFKPRKQAAKKIVVGGAVGTASVPQPTRSAGRGRGRGAGRGDNGAGRGRGRTPLPRGQVFFTGTPAAAASGKPSRGAGSMPGRGGGIKTAASAATSGIAGNRLGAIIKMEPNNKDTETEVIVGELDVGVGAHHDGSGKKVSVLERDDDDDGDRPYASDYQPETHFSIVETYDSDSSKEEDRSRNTVLRPTQLPFPIPLMPMGIGGSSMKRPALYDCQEEAVTDSQKLTPASPFCNSKNNQARQGEQDSWFLFQFPTRLPISQVVPEGVLSSEPEFIASSTPVVSTPALLETAFDNSMKQGGKLGTIKVYRSGKTVFDMGNGLVMDVTEGLPNGFFQQAIVIDPADGNYIVMGQVQKTVVVTPDVKGAFGT